MEFTKYLNLRLLGLNFKKHFLKNRFISFEVLSSFWVIGLQNPIFVIISLKIFPVISKENLNRTHQISFLNSYSLSSARAQHIFDSFFLLIPFLFCFCHSTSFFMCFHLYFRIVSIPAIRNRAPCHAIVMTTQPNLGKEKQRNKINIFN